MKKGIPARLFLVICLKVAAVCAAVGSSRSGKIRDELHPAISRNRSSESAQYYLGRNDPPSRERCLCPPPCFMVVLITVTK